MRRDFLEYINNFNNPEESHNLTGILDKELQRHLLCRCYVLPKRELGYSIEDVWECAEDASDDWREIIGGVLHETEDAEYQMRQICNAFIAYCKTLSETNIMELSANIEMVATYTVLANLKSDYIIQNLPAARQKDIFAEKLRSLLLLKEFALIR